MIEINFLSSRTRHKQKQKERDQKLFKIASIVLAVVVLILLLILGLKLIINLRIANKTKAIAELKQTIVDQEQVEMSYLIFVNKLRAVGEIFSARSDKQTAMNYFTELMTDIATITNMTYDEDSGGLILQLDHQNIFFLEKSMDIIDSDLVKDVYKNVKKDSLNRQDQGNYRLRLTIQLKTVEDLGLLDGTISDDEFANDMILEEGFQTNNNTIQESFQTNNNDLEEDFETEFMQEELE